LDRLATALLRDKFESLHAKCNDRVRLDNLYDGFVNWPAQFRQFWVSSTSRISASFED
jgi:hypothetical protein